MAALTPFRQPRRRSRTPSSRKRKSSTNAATRLGSASTKRAGCCFGCVCAGAVIARRQITKAIATYSFEKHTLSRHYRPAAAHSTVRTSIGEIERNKLPFHADRDEPWAKRKDDRRFPISRIPTQERPRLRNRADSKPPTRKGDSAAPETSAPIILIT